MKSHSNPFASRCMESIPYQFTDISLHTVMEQLASQNFRGSITGPKGSGKTTLLETIGRQLGQTGFSCDYLYFKKDSKLRCRQQLKPVTGEDISKTAYLIDGTEQLSRFEWSRLYSKIKLSGAVVLTAHVKSPLPPLIHTQTSPSLLYDLVLKLNGKTDMISEQAVFDLYHRHKGDIRQALRELYDVWAER